MDVFPGVFRRFYSKGSGNVDDEQKNQIMNNKNDIDDLLQENKYVIMDFNLTNTF